MTESSALKQRSLEQFGYMKYAVICPRDWRVVMGDREKEKNMLSKLIKNTMTIGDN